ncbi:MAG: universal stress protein [Burkholderiales bacterium]|jgi:nucleotide-binding universal stress UspA family protein|nr:universal stress protein [Burkholderiales bacterium]
MTKLLVAVDGSDNSARVIDFLIRESALYKAPIELHLLNAQMTLGGVNVKMFINSDSLKKYYKEEGEKALASARRQLDAAKVPYTPHISVGEPAEVIAAFVKSQGCDRIVMGCRGLGAVSGLVLGSVATKVLHLTQVPVTLIP